MSKLAQAKKQPETRSTLAQKVRWIRQQAGWNQAQAANEMGVSRGTFNGWETGREVIPPTKLHKLKHLAHVVLADFKPELVYGEDGYPAPFSFKKYDAQQDEYLDNDSYPVGLDPMDVEIAKLEGEEYLEREAHRQYLAHLRECAKWQLPQKTKAAFAREWLLSTDAAYFAEVVLEASKG